MELNRLSRQRRPSKTFSGLAHSILRFMLASARAGCYSGGGSPIILRSCTHSILSSVYIMLLFRRGQSHFFLVLHSQYFIVCLYGYSGGGSLIVFWSCAHSIPSSVYSMLSFRRGQSHRFLVLHSQHFIVCLHYVVIQMQAVPSFSGLAFTVFHHLSTVCCHSGTGGPPSSFLVLQSQHTIISQHVPLQRSQYFSLFAYVVIQVKAVPLFSGTWRAGIWCPRTETRRLRLPWWLHTVSTISLLEPSCCSFCGTQSTGYAHLHKCDRAWENKA